MSQTNDASACRPTRFADLNEVLNVFVAGVSARLGSKAAGIYLQGSFAIGDADEKSDCDFIVAVSSDLTGREIADLDALHRSIHQLPYRPWRHRLEGSYVPLDILRRWCPVPRDPPGEAARRADWRDPGLSGCGPRVYPFVYLKHGAQTLVRSEHDNTEVVRWTLREKGVVLSGPDPRELIDPVSPAALTADMRRTMRLCLDVDLRPLEKVRDQAFWIGLFCRMLHTAATGTVGSKWAALDWAVVTLDPRWCDLIERCRATRFEQGISGERAIAASDIAATHAFAAFAAGELDQGGLPSHSREPAATVRPRARDAAPPSDLPNDVRLKALARGAQGAAWLDGLPSLISDIAQRWSLAIGRPYAGGSEALVVAVRTVEGRDAVLKLAIPGLDPDQSELRALLAAAGRGYAEVLRHDGERGAMLLERLGPSLGSLNLSIDAQIAALCRTLREAWSAPPDGTSFTNGRTKAITMARYIEGTWSSLDAPCARRTIDVALRYAAERAAAFNPETAVLAHGDAHPGNTLVVPGTGRRRFKFVDPDGLLIERGYDLGIAMRGWSERLMSGDPVAEGRRRCALIAALSGEDVVPIWQWGFIERVGTGLLLMQIGARDRATATLAVADAWAREETMP